MSAEAQTSRRARLALGASAVAFVLAVVRTLPDSTLVRELRLENDLEYMDISPDGSLFAATSMSSAGSTICVEVFSLATGKRLRRIPVDSGKNVLTLAFTADSNAVAIGMFDGRVIIHPLRR